MLTEQKMDDLVRMVKGFAPGIATALGGPLAGMAVSALSKQLGVKDEVDAVMKAINKDPEAEAKIKQLEHDKFKAILADKNSAREREMAIAASEATLLAHIKYKCPEREVVVNYPNHKNLKFNITRGKA
jgi:hypothetical protein